MEDLLLIKTLYINELPLLRRKWKQIERIPENPAYGGHTSSLCYSVTPRVPGSSAGQGRARGRTLLPGCRGLTGDPSWTIAN